MKENKELNKQYKQSKQGSSMESPYINSKIKEFNKPIIYGKLIEESTNSKGNIVSYYDNDFAKVVIPNRAMKFVCYLYNLF